MCNTGTKLRSIFAVVPKATGATSAGSLRSN